METLTPKNSGSRAQNTPFSKSASFSEGGWKQIGSSDVFLSEYQAEGFGRTNCLAFAIQDGLAILSPSANPTPEQINWARKRGPVLALIAPHAGHTLGIIDWRKHFPFAVIYTAPGSISRIQDVCKVRGVKPISSLDVADPRIKITIPQGAKNDSLLLEIQREQRNIVYINEILSNLEKQPGKGPLKILFYLMGSRAGLGVNKGYIRNYVKEKKLLRDETMALLKTDPYVVMAHGPLLSTREDLNKAKLLLRSI